MADMSKNMSLGEIFMANMLTYITKRKHILGGVILLLLICFVLAACHGPADVSQTTDTNEVMSAEDTMGEATTDVHTNAEAITQGEPSTQGDGITEEAVTAEVELTTDAVIEGDTQTDNQEQTETPHTDATEETEQVSETQPPEVMTMGPIQPPSVEVDPSDVEKKELPRIDIKTQNNQEIESKDVYLQATISVSGCEEQYVLTDCVAEVRVRGNSTATAPKKPFRIKFQTKQTMLGLNNGEAFRSWCLMADYFDASMLRTWATFKFADVLLANKYYSADCTHVEVYVNGDYRGVYLLCEQTQINNDRVDIYEKADGDTNVDIGYLMIGQGGRNDEPESIVVYPEITVYDRNGDSMYFGGMNFALSGSGYTQAQKDYVSKYVSAVFKVVTAALYEDKYYNLDRDGNMTLRPSTELRGMTKQEKQIDTIDKVFCIESAVRMCILDEIVKNLDAMTFNMYVDLSPSGDGRLTLAAPWDFDFAMGNTNYSTTHSTSGFYATNLSYSEGMRTNLWYVMLGSIDWFEDMMKEQWQIKYHQLLEVATESLRMTYRYADAYQRDWDKWGHAANRGLIHHHCAADLQSFKNHTDNGEFVNSWLLARLKWLNRQWGDGTEQKEEAKPFVLDLTQQSNMSYFKDFKRCEGSITANGLYVVSHPADKYDPYFTFDLTVAPNYMSAEDYPILEIQYMIPTTNQYTDTYACELFLCSGNVYGATGGISTVATLSKADGKTHTLRIDLSKTGFWNGDIHAIRIDFFNQGEFGDAIYLKNITLKSN